MSWFSNKKDEPTKPDEPKLNNNELKWEPNPQNESNTQSGSIESRMQHALELASNRRIPEAIKELEGILKDHPTHHTCLAVCAEALQSQSRFAESAELIERAIKHYPNEPTFLVLKATNLMGTGKSAEAVETLDIVLRSAPNHSTALVGKSQALLALQRPAEAKQACDALLSSLAPLMVMGYVNHALASSQLGDLQGAKEISKRAMDMDPSSGLAITTHAYILSDLGQLDEALQYLDKVTPTDPAAHLALYRKQDILKKKENQLKTH